MARALYLARRGLYTTDPNPRVGCVIARKDVVLGEGWHERAGGPHAEVVALREAEGNSLHDVTAYVTLEPCSHHGRTPPCSQTLIKAKVKRVVVAMKDPNPLVSGQGLADLKAAGITVAMGLMETEARALNPGYVYRMETGRPWVRVKLAASLDGRTALANGQSQWITGAPAREDVQCLRARASAILTGVSTILHDDPSLNVRRFEIGRQPLRVVLDSTLRLSPDARLLKLEGKTLIVTASEDHDRMLALQQAGAEVLHVATSGHRIDLKTLMTDLVAREINELHVEAGATLCGALLHEGLVNELVLYLAPHLMGAHARGMFNFPGLESMDERVRLIIKDVRAVGEDWRITADVRH